MITILQPHIPHYREEFFKGISQKNNVEIFCYNLERSNRDGFQNANLNVHGLNSIMVGRFVFYNPFPLLREKESILVLMIDFTHFSTWILLLTKFFHRRKIILWGHGISIRFYEKEEMKPRLLLKWMLSLADGIWFYTPKEAEIWRRFLPKLKSVSLNNTISHVDNILTLSAHDKGAVRKKYNITQEIVLIFCARFSNPYRRIDLLIELIKSLDSRKFGFIIIGNGELKPNFDKYSNVYDFGAVYDFSVKTELFNAADIYFQPAWVGLSIVEAMAYGKPIFTFKRGKSIHQCVEYSYVDDKVNGLLFADMDQLISKLNNISKDEIKYLSINAKRFVNTELRMEKMIINALSIRKKL